MAQGNRQQESLETLKLINAASTALRLYPEESVQVRNAIENAYQGTKLFIRNNQLLRFSFLDGVYHLNGEPVDNPTRERLQLLTFSDQLQKMKLNELVLSKGFDRLTFKKILSVFSATPELINRSGGNRAFIEQLQLTAIFPEEYFAHGESKEEKRQKENVNQILEKLSGGVVRSDYILYLVGRKKEDALRRTLEQRFQSTENAARIIATTTYSLVQILHKDHIVVVAPAFSKMLVTISSLLSEKMYGKGGDGAATLLAPYLDQCVILMLICQDFSSPFGQYFYNSLIRGTNSETLAKVLDWIQGQQRYDGKKSDKFLSQLRVVSEGYEKLVATPRGKQILAMGATQDVLKKTEQGRKEVRLQAGITALAKGDLTSLRNTEVCQSIPTTIEKLLANDKESVAAAIIQNVVKGLTERKHELREQLALVLGGVAVKLARINRWDWLEKLAPVCLAWLRENEKADRSLGRHVLAMQSMMNHAWYSNNSDLAERILDVFYYIRSGAFEKTEAVRKLVGRIQDKNVDVVLLRGYLERCFVRPVDEMICRKILMQGAVAARFLLDTLITSDRRADRIRLLKILSELGAELVPVLLERLPDPMPWYGKRNIIRLLAATGAESDLKAIQRYASHEDLRVQQEVLHCIVRIGKASTAKYLLEVLPEAEVETKVQVLRNLRRVADESVVVPLANLLKECRLYSASERKMLALEISKTLGASGTLKALVPLQEIIDGGGKQFGKESVGAAELAVTFIQDKENGEKGSLENSTQMLQESVVTAVQYGTTSAASSSVSMGYELITEYAEENEVYALLQKDKKESAKKLLVELIEKTAQLRRFNEAESLRLRLIEIDGMALPEIIRAAELIEEAKSDSVDQDHIFVWSELYDLLTTEEFNAFYHSLEQETYSTEAVIVKQGDPQYRLFFVNKGRVKLYFNEKENETLVKTIGPGNVFGGASFFDDSVWTLNVGSMGAVAVSTLSMKCVDEWRDEYPALERKIQDYCLRFDRVNDFFLASGAERRQEERLPLSGVVKITLLDDRGQITDTHLRGEASDISTGGVSFLSRITQRKQARTLLGRHVQLSIENNEGNAKKTSLLGTVVAVRNLHSAELGRSVHISFDTELGSEKMMDLIHGS